MPSFRLHLLGSFRAIGPDNQPCNFRSEKSRALLAYLVLETQKQPVSRQSLMDLFWPDYLPSSARASLRTALSNLRAILSPLKVIESDNRQVRFHSTHPDFWCDALQPGPLSLSSAPIEAGLSFLQDLYLDDCPEFMAWVEKKRTAFRSEEDDQEVAPTRWEAVPEYRTLVGRESELAQLTQWLVTEKCRLVGIFGQGGQGKSSLAAGFAHSLAGQTFDQVIWCSLLNAPPWTSVLEQWVSALSKQPPLRLPAYPEEQFALLMEMLSQQRCLLVLDNLETILVPGDLAGRFQPGYAEFGRFLDLIAHTAHRSALLITSREQPAGFTRWLRSSKSVRELPLPGLSLESGQQLLSEYLPGQSGELTQLVERFSGNPLALLLAVHTMQVIFANDVTAFLAEETPIGGDLQQVLQEQVERLSEIERWVFFQIATLREPVSWASLRSYLPSGYSFAELVNGLQSLQRRSLISVYRDAATTTDPTADPAQGNAFGLQNVILEFATERLIEGLTEEIARGSLHLLRSLALVRAGTLEYIRDVQARLILEPILNRIRAEAGGDGVIRRLRSLLKELRGEIPERVQYAATNILHLLLALSPSAVQGADFSDLPVPDACLRDTKLPGVTFANAHLGGAAFTLLLSGVRCVAVHPQGQKIGAGTVNGLVWIWEVGEQRAYALPTFNRNQVNRLVFSQDGALLVYTCVDGTVRLWDVDANRLRDEFVKGEGESIALGADGRIVAGCDGDQVWLWDVAARNFLPP